MARPQPDPVRRGGEGEGVQARPQAEHRPQRLREHQGTVVLRLPAQLPLRGQVLGKTAEAARAAVYGAASPSRSTVDLRFQRAADNAVEDHVYPTDNAIGGLAMVEPGTGYVKALAQSRPMGPNKKKGETFLNYVVPEAVRRLQRLPWPDRRSRSFVLAAAIKHEDPAEHHDQLAPARCTSPRTTSKTCNGYYDDQRRHGTCRSSTTTGAEEPLHRHPRVGEHVLRAAGADDRASASRGSSPRRWASRFLRSRGRQARLPADHRAVLHPRHQRHQPARDGRGVRDVRQPRASTAPRPRPRDPRPQRRGHPD